MNAKELAEKLNGNQYGHEISKELIREAINNDLVVVFGYSDDNIEFRGVIYDEISCYGGGTVYFDENGLLENRCDDEDCPYFELLKENAKTIEAIVDSDGYCWIYETSIPHETFEIFEDGEKYCRGIVFNMKDLK